MDNTFFILRIYAPIVTYIMNLVNFSQNFQDFDKTRKDIELLLSNIENELKVYEIEHTNDLLLPLIAFIDEKIFLSNSEISKVWVTNNLQKKYFNTLDCGKLYFDKLESFNDESNKSIKLIYILFLNLGFKGKYYLNEDYKYYEYLEYYNIYFKKNLDYLIDTDFFRNSYISFYFQESKNKYVNIKRSLLLFIILLSFISYFLFLNLKLNQKQQNIINSSFIETKKGFIDTDNETFDKKVQKLFNKKSIPFDITTLTATIRISPNSFTKIGLNSNDYFKNTLDLVIDDLLIMILKYDEINSVNIHSYTSSEFKKYNGRDLIVDANKEISQRRANKIKAYFLDRSRKLNLETKIIDFKINAIGEGISNLIFDSNNNEDINSSRRIEIQIIKNNKGQLSK